MAEIDCWLSNLTRRGADRMVLTNDQRVRVISRGYADAGPVIGAARLRRAIAEVMPLKLHSVLAKEGHLQFIHAAPCGLFQIIVEHDQTFLRVTALPFKSGHKLIR